MSPPVAQENCQVLFHLLLAIVDFDIIIIKYMIKDFDDMYLQGINSCTRWNPETENLQAYKGKAKDISWFLGCFLFFVSWKILSL